MTQRRAELRHPHRNDTPKRDVVISDPRSPLARYEPGVLEERFWPKVQKTDTCWLWTASLNDRGYGQFKVLPGQGHAPMKAHRFSWELHFGPIPAGLVVCHRCDVPSCVNPAHLFIGTQGDNLRDMSAKGRHWQAHKTHCAQGHPFDDANTRYRRSGNRECKTCHKEACRQGRLRKKSCAAVSSY